MPGKLALKLFNPGMTHLHKVGLAGLYMTLKQLDPSAYQEQGGWNLSDTGVEFFWNRTPRDLLGPVIENAFGISKEGLIDFLVHRNSRIGDIEKVQIHKAILQSFLQHGRTRTLGKKEVALSFEYDDKKVTERIKPLIWYQHQKNHLFKKNGEFSKNIKLAGWAFPGGGVRHVAFSPPTTLTTDSAMFLCLLFAPAGSLYFLIASKNQDGKYDHRKGAAIVLPHITNLHTYEHCYRNYLESPVVRLYANSLGDAGLSALAILNLHYEPGTLRQLEINSCSVITLGTIPWAKQQKTRTAVEQIKKINSKVLSFFDYASKALRHRFIIKNDETYYVQTSTARGLIAENIAANRPWFENFYTIMQSKALARQTCYDRKGLQEMTQSDRTSWPEEDGLLVEAVHNALRNRYGALAARAKVKGEQVRFEREFERIRTSLMRAKNVQTMRAELADLFARGGINKSLQRNWKKILPIFTGKDWQKSRDLALLALASYAGKGADAIEKQEDEEDTK